MLVRLVGFAVALACTAAASAESLTVFAAASLREALDAQVRTFGAKAGSVPRVVYAGSSTLARQIEQGAPAQVFISADIEWMEYLATRRRIVAETRRNLVSNRLVLIAPTGTGSELRIEKGMGLGTALAGGRLALANPDIVPAGRYAKSALQALGVWHGLSAAITNSENVRAALMLVARREAPLGIVYASDARAEPRVRVVDTFSASLHAPIVYPAAVIAPGTPAARALVEYLAGREAQAVWRAHGFTLPE
ncbi:MAG: molybdate ABC transporter substrate-binding protein [Burkholderiales bacterium]